jgi:uncharacterized protein (DUF885 family)
MARGLLHPTRRSLLAGAASIGAGSLLGPVMADTAPSNPSAMLRALIAQSVRAEAALDPLQAARHPSDGPAAFVDPLSDAYAATRLATKRDEMAKLTAIDRAQLDDVDRIAWDVFHYKTQQALDEFSSGLFEVARLTPLDPSFGLQVNFPDAASGESVPFKTVQDYDNGLIRLQGFAGYLTTTIARLKEGLARGYRQPKIVVRNVIAEVDTMLAARVEDTPFYKPILNMPATIATADRERLTRAYSDAIAKSVLPGYQLWKSYLSDTYLAAARDEPGLWAMKDGDRLYAQALRNHTTTTLTADQIHDLGLSEVARIRGEMDAVAKVLGFPGNLRALFEHVRTDPKFYFQRPEDLLNRFKEIEARIWAGMPRLFARKPKAPFEVRPLPAMGAARGTGYYNLGPPDGSAPGVLYFNMAMLPTRPIPTLETLTLHEGIPGHHYQGSLAQENLALPDILRFGGDFTAYIEGWGLYSESLGKELGLFGDPWQWYGHLDFEMLRAVRLVVDTGMHAKGWSRDRAIAFATDNTSMAAKDIQVEIDRYIAVPGQATAYKVGELKLKELRSRAETKLGARFDIRQFHDQILMTGSMPLGVLEGKIDAWLASTAG